jgi:hypothetical protein
METGTARTVGPLKNRVVAVMWPRTHPSRRTARRGRATASRAIDVQRLPHPDRRLRRPRAIPGPRRRLVGRRRGRRPGRADRGRGSGRRRLRRHGLRPHALRRPQAPDRRPRGAQPHPHGGAGAFRGPLRRGRAAARAAHPGLHPLGPARLVRGAGRGDLRGLERAGLPRAFKASPLLRAWLRRLDSLGVRFALRHRWEGWTTRAPSSSRERTASGSRPVPMPRSSRSAARAGPGSARTGPGRGCWPRGGSRSRPCARPTWASRSRGPRS